MKFPVGCRRLLPVLCILCLLLSGCGGSAGPGEKHLHTLADKAFTAVCDTRLTAGGVESTYTLTLRHSDGQSEIVLQAPEEHAGITVLVDGDAELPFLSKITFCLFYLSCSGLTIAENAMESITKQLY